MTQPETLSVEYVELMARADELEAAIPGRPSDNPGPPCTLAMIVRAAEQIELSADNMRLYLDVAFNREWPRLAESLRNAAKAYEVVDEDAAAAIIDDTSVSAETPEVADDEEVVVLTDTAYVTAASDPSEYLSVEVAASYISQGDQGNVFSAFADAWTTYQQNLQEANYLFRPFTYWEGDAANTVEANFDEQRSWLQEMADLCATMATQARDIVSAHGLAVSQHPTVAQVSEVSTNMCLYYCPGVKKTSFAYNDICQNTRWNCKPDFWTGAIDKCQWKDGDENKQNCNKNLQKRHADMQQQSEKVLAEYETTASLPLSAVNPPTPPSTYYIAAASEASSDADSWDEYLNDLEAAITDSGTPDSLTDNLSGLPSMPSMPEFGGLDPSALTDPPMGVPAAPGPSTGPGSNRRRSVAVAAEGACRRCRCSPRWTSNPRPDPSGRRPARAWAAASRPGTPHWAGAARAWPRRWVATARTVKMPARANAPSRKTTRCTPSNGRGPRASWALSRTSRQ